MGWHARVLRPYELFVDYSRVTCMCSVGQVGVCIYPVCSMVHKFVFSRFCSVLCVCVCVCCVCVCVIKKCLLIVTLIGQISLQKGCILLVHSLYMSPEMFARSIEMYRECYIPQNFYSHNSSLRFHYQGLYQNIPVRKPK